ncbi:MAG: 1-acyl-sn-glycerol-3-phosphate acyltransferase, partial [Leptolyngbya sp. SIO4C1]|nr:1-acyl-sn-glycerol-3-phosphate acyltransferase [Leptolyngbya sp. SIO4C1]
SILYQRVSLLVGQPVWITPQLRADYQGRQAVSLVNEITQTCHDRVASLLKQGCY